MTSKKLRKNYLDYYKQRGHTEIPPAPLVLMNDPTTLFTSSGMQPLVPYLMGQPHPKGTRLVDSQPCFRGQGFFDDTVEVGNRTHTTFFEMLGNWSLGDYFKEDQLAWYWEFLTKELGLPEKRLFVTVFEGTKEVPRDEESASIWKKLGVPKERIFYYGVKKNWWSRSGTPKEMPVGEIGGPDSEVFFQFDVEHNLRFGKHCHPNCECGRFLEIGNSVFIQYLKQADGTFKELPQKNVDFGGGLERHLAVVTAIASKSLNNPDLFATDLFSPIITTIEEYSGKSYQEDQNKPAMRVIADHLKGAAFMMKAGVIPSNKEQGYILRRLLRRSAIKMHSLHGGLTPIPAFQAIVESVMRVYDEVYFDFGKDRNVVDPVVEEEMGRFAKTLDRGLRQFEKIDKLDGKAAFDLFQSYGFPFEITSELAAQKGQEVNQDEFREELKKHQILSKGSMVGKFTGGLADHSVETTKLHTTAHLLHQALRNVLGDHVRQAGQNITAARLRFDFTHPQALTDTETKEIEAEINKQVDANLPVKMEMMSLEQANKQGAIGLFTEKYGEEVKVYSIGPSTRSARSGSPFSMEICGGPHVDSTGQIGRVKIVREKAVGEGRRRLYVELAR